jgi:site-specific DNA recombinase
VVDDGSSFTSGPFGLSDYAVSPLGMPTALLRDEVRVAFLGRTSTEDQQDPRQSLIRQLGNCKTTIPMSWVIVAHFYDVESGRMELDRRGQGSGYERFDIPIARDGGIADLLTESRRQERRFDVVICESISRVARRAFEGLSIERALEQADVPLFASNEPITLSGSRAQRILQRRINQSVAEYEVLNTLEQSWGGLCTHVRDGWNIGKPPYGYRAKTYRHPNPTKAAKGQTKTRLEPDGRCGETVTQIAAWRRHEGLGYNTIADRLNTDLEKYPPPTPPNPGRARGHWGKTSVYEILCNPKYTGYQVFNRRASRSRHGKVNDPMLWVWSPEPVHEPLIPKWMYDEIAAGRRPRRRAIEVGHRLSKHPQTRRKYRLRGMVVCDCGRRMFGCRRRGTTSYYQCKPDKNNKSQTSHSVYVREDGILDVVTSFFAERIFGEDRRAALAAELSSVDDTADRQRQADEDHLKRTVANIERRQAAVLRQAMDGDPDDPFTKALRATYNDLDAEKAATEVALAANAKTTETDRPTPENLELLDALPYLAAHLLEAPEDPATALRGHPAADPAPRRGQPRDDQHSPARRPAGRRRGRGRRAGQDRRRTCGLRTCPRRDSNPH